jgi:PhnB protein
MKENTPDAAPSPTGLRTLTPQLWFNGDCAAALDFYERAFGARIHGHVVRGAGGKGVVHAVMKLGESRFILADALPGFEEYGNARKAASTYWLHVDDCEDVFRRAVRYGAESIQAPKETFWGDIMAKVQDPFGYVWAIAAVRRQSGVEEREPEVRERLERRLQEA